MGKYYLAIDIGASSGRHILAEIVDGKLVKYDISYTMDVASMDLKALGAVSVGGSGAGKLECTYSDFKY